MEVKFTPEHKVVNDLFAREVRYIIPEYQRPYSWSCEGKSDKNNQVNTMWDDLYGYFLSARRETYFFGSMVLIGNGDRIYQVVDGQQRLTTMMLLFASIKSFIFDVKTTISDPNLIRFSDRVIKLIDELTFDEKLHGAIALEKKVKIEKSEGFDYDEILTKVLECKQFDREEYRDVKAEQLVIISRYFANTQYFIERLKDCFLTDGHFTESNAEKLNDFLDFIKNKVSVVRILTGNFEIAYHIFEILNNRGLPLTNKDLFRNFLIREFSALKEFDKDTYTNIIPTEKWAYLEGNYEMRDDFLSRWVESVNAKQQEYSAFNDLKKIYEHQYHDKIGGKKIEIFYADIQRDLEYFTKIINQDVNNPFLRAKLRVLLNAGNSRYTLNFLLAIWRHYNGDEEPIMRLVNAYENFLLHKLLVGRFVSGPVYGAISNLSKPDGLDQAIATLSPKSLQDRLKEEITHGNLDNDAGKLLISKWIWIKEAETSDDLVEQILDFGKATLEHIIPQNPEKNTNWEKDFDADFISRFTFKLGNMTLLIGRHNSEAKNFGFNKKKVIYAKTKLFITQELANLPSINPEIIKERHKKITQDILYDLGLSDA